MIRSKLKSSKHMISGEDTSTKEYPPAAADKMFTSTFYKQLDQTRNILESANSSNAPLPLHRYSKSVNPIEGKTQVKPSLEDLLLNESLISRKNEKILVSASSTSGLNLRMSFINKY